MKNFKSLLGLLIMLGCIGGGAYAGWYYLVHENVEATTPAQKECVTEKGMVADAVKQANKSTAPDGLMDPNNFIHTAEAQKYYTWGGIRPNWQIQPIGTPPC